MSLSPSSQRLASFGLRNVLHSSPILPFLHPSLIQRRTLLERLWGRKKETQFLDPLSPDFLKRVPSAYSAPPKPGDLAPSSIFESDRPSSSQQPSSPFASIRNPAIMAAALDPTPHARKRWQRKMLIRDIRGRFRMNKTVKILRTERFSLSKSAWIKTSLKKLGPLARQIAGKPIEDAIVQMRFSKKKAAADVKKHLEYARDEAMVRKGMGLGMVKRKGGDKSMEGAEGTAEAETEEIMTPIVVEDRKGKRRTVTDRTSIYVDQAWVGRGVYGKEPSYRARGRVDVLQLPYTSISVILKEEKTRIRLAEEREQKRQRKKVWVPLPDRPITAQRQYCLW